MTYRVVHRTECTRDVDTDGRGLARRHRPIFPDDGLERVSVHQLHPDAGHAVGHIGAIDRDDVLVAHAREHAAFLHHRFGI